jgi:ADP-glucose pyrophosphorylase
MNTLKDIGLLTQSLSYALSTHLISAKSLSAENLSMLLIILQSDDMDQLYRSMGKYDKLAKGIQNIEK